MLMNLTETWAVEYDSAFFPAVFSSYCKRTDMVTYETVTIHLGLNRSK